jgi:hypothetical protein
VTSKYYLLALANEIEGTPLRLYADAFRNSGAKIETQSARIAELEAALKKIVEKTRHAHPMSYESGYYRIAHDALEGGKKDE